jgi:peroxiredoxin
MSVRRTMLAAVAAGALLLAGCGGTTDNGPTGDAMDPAPERGPTSPTNPGPTDPGPTGEAGAGAPPPPAHLDFTATTVDGDSFDGYELLGQPAVLWFWAPWCGICAGQAPDVRALAEDYAGTATVVGVAGLDDSVEAMRGFIDRHGLQGVTHLADPDGTVWRLYEVTAQSTFVILDETGAVVERGITGTAELPHRLDPLVG